MTDDERQAVASWHFRDAQRRAAMGDSLRESGHDRAAEAWYYSASNAVFLAFWVLGDDP
jgi:hypothetical protein